MTPSELATLIAPAEHLLGYFDQQALASYRNEPEKYVLETDSFEGRLTVTNSYYEELEAIGCTDEYLDLKFGYRTLANGDLCIVLWLPDLKDAPKHQSKWLGSFVASPLWIDEYDERFRMWVMRYLEGSWDVDNGPKYYLSETINTINGLTNERVGLPLFDHPIDASLGFPAAENTHRYQDAHVRLYGFLIDGISKECLGKLAEYAGLSSNYASDKTIAALAKLLPRLGNESTFAQAAALISDQRRLASHAVRPRATKYAAFSTFTKDLHLCLRGLREVLAELEVLLGMNGSLALRRFESRSRLPKLVSRVHVFASILQASKMEGKTVLRVEYGGRNEIEGLHNSEALIVYFTDGSVLGIDTGSNVRNITSRRDDLRPEEFSTDFMLSWVPPLNE